MTNKKEINEHIDKFITGIEDFISNFLLAYSLNLFNKFKLGYQQNTKKFENYAVYESWKKLNNRIEEAEKRDIILFCIESDIMFLNKILLLRICEDKGILPRSLRKFKLYGEDSIFKSEIRENIGLNLIFKRIEDVMPITYNLGVIDWQAPHDENFNKYLTRIITFFYKFEFKNLDQDIFGYIYEKNLFEDKKKSLGQFYTPIEIIDYILEKAGYKVSSEIENLKLIDPCCGSGSFLIRAIKTLIERYKLKFESDKFMPKQAKIVLQSVTNNINGLEINQFSCALAILNIFFQIIDLYYNVLEHDITYVQPPFHVYNINVLELKFPNPSIINSIKPDIVVGNPPYIFLRDIPKSERERIQSLDLKTNKGQWDLYQLFIEIGIKFLNEAGNLGFIVPDSILANSERKIIREFIYKNCNIKLIHHIGKKFKVPVVSNVILVLQKLKPPNYRGMTKLIFSSKRDTINIIKQNKIKDDWDFNFYLHLSKEDDNLINKLKKFPTIDDIDKNNPNFYIKISRGVELTKKGLVFYCSTCKIYYPLPEKLKKCKKCGSNFAHSSIETIVNEKKPSETYKLFVTDLNRYKIQQYKYIKINKEGVNYKSSEIYSPNRIIIRQLSENGLICATIEPKGAYTSQSIYNINSNLNPYYLLGIINSKLMSYFFSKIFGSYKRLFPRILIESIKKLPIIIPDKENEMAIANLVKKILEINKRKINEPDKLICILDIQPQLDSLVFNLYGLNLSEKILVRNYFTKINQT